MHHPLVRLAAFLACCDYYGAYIQGFDTRTRQHECCVSICVLGWGRAPAKNGEDDNSVAEVYLQLGPDTLESRAALDLIAQACQVAVLRSSSKMHILCVGIVSLYMLHTH